MIVVIGIPAWRAPSRPDEPGSAAGSAVAIACAAAADGAGVELVGKVGDDPEGDALLADLARAAVGHAAVLRDPARPTRIARLPSTPTGPDDGTLDAELGSLVAVEVDESAERPSDGRSAAPEAALDLFLEPADLELALRYLVEFRVVVVAEPLSAPALTVVADAAGFAGAHLVVAAPGVAAESLAVDATLFEPPASDPEGAFARLVADYAVALDRGEAPEAAFRTAATDRGWEPAG